MPVRRDGFDTFMFMTPYERDGLWIMGGISKGDKLRIDHFEDNRGTPSFKKNNFHLKYAVDDACIITVHSGGSVFIILGGSGGFDDPDFRRKQMKRASQYHYQTGYFGDLPPLNIGRMNHACTTYNNGNSITFLVTGGWRGSKTIEDNYIQETEIHGSKCDKKWNIVPSASFPTLIRSARAVTVNDNVFVLGEMENI